MLPIKLLCMCLIKQYKVFDTCNAHIKDYRCVEVDKNVLFSPQGNILNCP